MPSALGLGWQHIEAPRGWRTALVCNPLFVPRLVHPTVANVLRAGIRYFLQVVVEKSPRGSFPRFLQILASS